jgi:hypothetical protein
MSSYTNYFTVSIPLTRQIVYRIFVLAAVLLTTSLAMADEFEWRNNAPPKPNINYEQPFVLTVLLYDKRKATADAKELADSVGAKIIQSNPMAATYWLRLPTKDVVEVGAMMNKLEADPRVFGVKWDIH